MITTDISSNILWGVYIMGLANNMINMQTSHQLISFPVAGAAAGLGLYGANTYYSQALYGNSMNDPFMGQAWDFVLTGAGIGGGAALVSAGIKFQAAQLRNSRINEYTSQGLSHTSAQLLAMSGK